jgi:Ca2+-dependent lipid-binding protein
LASRRKQKCECTFKFIEINEAYEILINPTKRIEYEKLFNDSLYTEVSTEFRQWQDKAKEKAETYAKMNSVEFDTKILKELKLVGKYSGTFGCFFILILGTIVNLWMAFTISPIGWISVLVFGGGAIYVYNTSIKGYSEERKNL